ncbi:ABC transporter ATP-binding protein [Pelagibacterium flavum]|uniref:ABC transporter ATP-binding protein n=1 Tax=Pelagibacterium flavum TaxID=2984530 RepID=A0ABY6IJZ6_9HYPH|nr:ABC transporter ATP-binding protein [Pelagibacterium sp. YIM 151497]UYQ70888.1 ABC transporter ATP-binding protein [Pelagibacterium sp. YIM 151497]
MSKSVPAIEVRNVVKSFAEFRAIDNVSLTVESGIFITLLGPSGCGKSTLLRSIAGFLAPDSGSILVGGRDVTALPPHIRPVNMVFQDYALFPHMSVRRNVGFGCEMKGMTRSEIEARVDAMLELIRLPDVGNREPGELSGGQRQRVALARALAPDPVSLLLDEPLGALDLKLRLELQHELKSIQRTTGKTFVFVTHDQDEAMSMSDLVAVMKDGRIEQLGTPRAIYARPATAFVAGFVGAANMLPARVCGIDGARLNLEVEGQNWVVPTDCITGGKSAATGDLVTLVIRPEDVIVGSGPGLGELALSARAREQTFLGGRIHLRCQTANGTSLTLEVRPGSALEGDGILDVYVAQEAVAILVDQKETVK